jgi:uncharacterized membrane protein YtjA (UPF0391 family)
MFDWAITFLIIGLVAALFGITGIGGTAVHIAGFVVFLLLGRRSRL